MAKCHTSAHATSGTEDAQRQSTSGGRVMKDEEKTQAQLLSEVAELRQRVTTLKAQVSRQQREQDVATRLAAIVESSDDAIIGITVDGAIVSWNGGAERLYGYVAGEVIGHPISFLIPSDRSDELPQILRRIACGERVEHYETERVRKDGKHLSVSLTTLISK